MSFRRRTYPEVMENVLTGLIGGVAAESHAYPPNGQKRAKQNPTRLLMNTSINRRSMLALPSRASVISIACEYGSATMTS